ncbi:glycosyltransferase family protein [Endozoicomonas euniceicola]|uniref:Glycosyltransferase family 1 protein n=1 Tax=Endozoicomonas euniceicola TaxID=1234143 RepID=A0ABY6H0H5_9GAMM|nr:hypothetical protein [Endozoicomonas euniceicola]UYM18546.1 hypothetical protein NX720_11795 [Endozoicomonas euniceicola]
MPAFFSPKLFKPCGTYNTPWNGNIVLLTDSNSPTRDIYFTCRYPEENVREVFSDCSPEVLEHFVSTGDFVVIIRNQPARLLKTLKKIKYKFAGVAWFIDDDIPAAWSDPHLPGDYGRRLTWSYLKIRHLLSGLCDRIWVSTQWLAGKYCLPESDVISPGLVSATVPDRKLRYFYHGSKSHLREMRFLRPVVEEIQKRYDFAQFEIFGDHEVYKLFRDIPGVRIVHPMKWNKFKHYTATANLDIGLAPVLESPFNKARSHNKMLDISRSGAVGIYSELHALSGEIAANNAGLVVNNEPEQWVESFDQMLRVDRTVMLANARQMITQIEKSTDLQALIRDVKS